ncbi:MAG: glycosyltransferase family 4 protein, partial [Acidobacteriota bacterium]|nr:glycosyltransferase family 4 protein [Acidobacteriota bacterium]
TYLGFTSKGLVEPEKKLNPRLRPFLLYVGSRLTYKNFERLLEAFAASPLLKNDFDLVCFGGGAFTSKEISLFQQLGLSDECCCQVSGDDATLAALYGSARAFVYPSLYEGFGIPPLEAMSFNCPVVCSGLSSIPEVVGNAAEMFDPYDPESIQKAIERVATDEVLRETLVSRGRERVKQFSWERCAKETLDVYSRVLS